MAEEFEDFLKRYFTQLRFNEMPVEVRARFDGYKEDELDGHMKKWRKTLMHRDGSGELVENDLPDFSTMDEAELKKLYKKFRAAFIKLEQDKDKNANEYDFDVQNTAANDFLKKYFTDIKAVKPVELEITPEAQDEIENLKKLLNGENLDATEPTDQEQKTANISAIKIFLKDKNLLDLSALKKGLEEKKYETDTDFRNKLIDTAEYINAATIEGYAIYNPIIATQMGKKSVNNIVDGFVEKDVSDKDLDAFKGALPDMLHTLATKDKVRNAFGVSEVTNAYDKAKQQVAYDDTNSKDYVPPKHEDKLNPYQRFQKQVGKNYKEHLKGYFGGQRIYHTKTAKSIVEAITKANIKPTSGLDEILKQSKEISEHITPQARGHFKWMTETLTELQKNSTSENMFKKALKSGASMRALVEELIVKAVEQGKLDEAETAMEVLSTIRYGYTTSKTLDALRNEDFTLFSGSDLSWNKNEAMQVLTKAMDKGIKWAFLSVGYVAKGLVHGYNMTQIKFGKNTPKRLQKPMEHAIKNQRQDLEKEKSALDAGINSNKAKISAQQNIQISTGVRDYDAESQALKTERDTIDDKRQKITTARANIATAKSGVAYTTIERESQLNAQKQELINQNQKTIAEYKRYEAILKSGPGISVDDRNVIQERMDELRKTAQQQAANAQQIDAELQNITGDAQYDSYKTEHDKINKDEQSLKNAEDKWNAREEAANDKETKLNKFHAATEQINELNAHNTKMEEQYKKLNAKKPENSNSFKRLMDFWNKLEHGRDTRLGKMWQWAGKHSERQAALYQEMANRTF